MEHLHLHSGGTRQRVSRGFCDVCLAVRIFPRDRSHYSDKRFFLLTALNFLSRVTGARQDDQCVKWATFISYVYPVPCENYSKRLYVFWFPSVQSMLSSVSSTRRRFSLSFNVISPDYYIPSLALRGPRIITYCAVSDDFFPSFVMHENGEVKVQNNDHMHTVLVRNGEYR